MLIQEFAARLPPDAGGVVVNLLDERVWNLTPYFVSYTVSKAALWTLTQTMALALAPRIRVNGDRTRARPCRARARPPSSFVRQCRSMPLRRGTSPEEIAAALRFILAAPAMTGQMIALDGGEHLGWAQPGQTPRSNRMARHAGCSRSRGKMSQLSRGNDSSLRRRVGSCSQPVWPICDTAVDLRLSTDCYGSVYT